MKDISINIEELACIILGIEYDTFAEEDDETAETAEIEDVLIDRMNIDLDTLYSIVKKLLPLIEIGESPLTGTCYKGFVKRLNNSGGTWLARIEAE